jgi:homoserine O-acetyltransferase/O-succinyltransferase
MNDSSSIGIVEPQYFTFAEPPGELELACGRKLGPVTIAYETYGTLNADKSNAVLILHALSGDAHAAGYHGTTDRKPGWWDNMIGPGKGFDTNKYFVICSNVLGGCQGSTGPSSIDPATGKPFGLHFPIITIGDMVRAQRQLIEHLGIKQLLSVAGGSMGGMQAMEWMTRYPELTKSAMVIASTHRLSAQAIAFDAVGRHAIQADHEFHNGEYLEQDSHPAQGLSIARMLAHITYLSDDSMRAKFGRALRETEEYRYDFASEFSVETYLDYQGAQFVNRFDANSYLYITKAINYFDIAAPYGDLDKVMALAQCKVMVLSYSSDWLYPPYQSQEIVHALTRQKKDVTYCNIKSDYGHDAFLLETGAMRKIIGGFLHNVAEPFRYGRAKKDVEIDTDSEAELGPAPTSPSSIYEGVRVDYDMIVDLVQPNSRVLDIGCGNGELLSRLLDRKDVDAVGIEIKQGNIISCIRRGISVVQGNIDDGLPYLPDQSFDYALLSMTLQVVEKPEFVLAEMVRVAKRCIVSFPNFAFWKVRAKVIAQGRAPVTRNLPYAWFNSPNRHVLSIKDFRQYCETRGMRIEHEIPLSGQGQGGMAAVWPNLFADEAVFVITSHKMS